MVKVKLTDCKSLDDFLREVNAAGSIRLVKVEDYGLTAPVNRGGAVVIEPRVRVVVTAFDKRQKTIFRWQETAAARQAAGLAAEVGRGRGEVAVTPLEKERVRQRLQLEGFVVESGEWMPSEVETLLRQMAS